MESRTPNPYKLLRAKTRLYGLGKNSIDQYDLETGKKNLEHSVKPSIEKNSILAIQYCIPEVESGKEIPLFIFYRRRISIKVSIGKRQ